MTKEELIAYENGRESALRWISMNIQTDKNLKEIHEIVKDGIIDSRSRIEKIKNENITIKTTPNGRTWIVDGCVCKDCDSNLIICQPRILSSHDLYDYWWYCSNKMCKNHWLGEELGDQEECSFAKDI